MKHTYLALLLVSSASMFGPACKPKEAVTPTDTCDALTRARNKTLKEGLERFNGKEIGLEKFVKAIQIASNLDMMISDRRCPAAPGPGGADADSHGLAGAPSSEGKFVAATQTALDSNAKNLNGLFERDRSVTDHDVSTCLLRQQACKASENPELKAKLHTIEELAIEKVLHGRDNRRMWSELAPREKQAAQAAVSIFTDDGWVQSGSDWIYPLKSLKDLVPSLCTDERFRDEPTASNCSGAVVSDRWVATARHCVAQIRPAKLRIVAGYGTRGGSEFTTSGNRRHLQIPTADYYKVEEIKTSPDGEDWALLKLDRAVTGFVKPLTVDSDRVTQGHASNLAAIGHPLGLPLIYANDAAVLDLGAELASDLLFYASLDTYAGNSGSPIINVATNKMVGILIRGDSDFVARRGGSCQSSRACGIGDACRGEVVQRVHAGSTFARALATIGASVVPSPGAEPTDPPTKPAGRATKPAARSK